MKFFSAVAVCAMAAIKPVIGQSIVTFQVGSATPDAAWNIEDNEFNNVAISFDVPDTAGLPHLSATAEACAGATDFTLGTVAGDVEDGLDVQVINNGPVVDASYCIVVKLSFDFTGGTGPQVIHQRTFTFTVEANPDGTATPSPVERVDGFIDITEADSEEVGNDVENRDLTGISLISNPTSEVTYNELVTLTVFAPTCCGAYWYQITAVTIDGTAIAITPNPGAWAIGSTASVTFTIPISVFVVAGQGGDIEIVGTVQWSAVDPSRRALRALQDGSESEQLPESGTTTSTISISVDPASLEEANSVTSAGYSFKITKTMIGATGALAAVAVL